MTVLSNPMKASLLVVFSLLSGNSDSFRILLSDMNSNSMRISMSLPPGSYLQQLQQALAARGQSAPSITPPRGQDQNAPVLITSPSQSAPQTSIPNPLISKEEKRSFESSSKFPFNDEIYDDLKYVINRLTEYAKGASSISIQDADEFEAAIQRIIADAWSGIGIPKPLPSTSQPVQQFPPSVSQPTSSKSRQKQESVKKISNPKMEMNLNASPASSDFGAFRGLRSTWEIQGMDTMTTEEYYNALNKRNSEISRERRRSSTHESNSGATYIESLNKKRQKEN
jgi:hypothetical protein